MYPTTMDIFVLAQTLSGDNMYLTLVNFEGILPLNLFILHQLLSCIYSVDDNNKVAIT